MSIDFNGELLRLARQYRGFNQRELASKLSVEPSTISRFENGILSPSGEVLQQVAEITELPLEFFSQPDRVYGLPVSVHPMWRKKNSVLQPEIDRALAELNIRIMHLRRLIRAVEYEPVLPLPQFDVEAYAGDIEKITQMVRRTWLMPAGPVHNLTEWIERAGCFVVHVDLPDSAMDGVTLRTPDIPPCIFINANQPADRMRFTLAHELGHLVMHRLPTLEMEKEAHAFASALLMPAQDIRPYFVGRRIDLSLLAGLKQEWRCSMQALLYRAQDLNFIDYNQSRYLWQQFNKHKIKLREPSELDFAPECPTLMPKMITLHLEGLGYSLSELSASLAMHEAELIRFYGISQPDNPPGRPKLRIV